MSIDENTLGVPRHRRAPRGLPTSSTGARSMRQAQQAGATLGTGYLGMGAAAVAALQAIYGLIFFLVHLSSYPVAAPAIVAWLVYLAAFIGVVTLVAIQGERLTGPVMIGLCAALALVVVLDFIAIWPLHNVGAYATASISVGFGLLPLITLRPARELIIATAALFVLLVGAVILTTPIDRVTFPQQVATIALAVLPPAIATYAVQRFRGMIQIELDRVLVQSTVTQPRFAVGMLASDELARLDLAAEKLLDGVAVGDIPLPLEPQVASTAASLATELRLHLIEGRRETWLYHAVTESEYLGRAVKLADPSSLAGLLTPEQRDGLLQAVWLLLGDRRTRAAGTSITLTLGPIGTSNSIASLAGRTIDVPIDVTSTGIRRNRVTPATWNALNRVGDFQTSTHQGSLRLAIRCSVENPADA
ncbi:MULTISPECIES: hypothetical protein [unclassified Frondihabitans]|uniref:hypothetical protein n=1 Tax=unclassified Frondihabitans TaxID=2626248 RepID=UPI000F4D6D14|nr:MULTISPECIES: hypothetical protein [unclassified Frondihabitans]MBF4576233.1 hypothetical protein [Frondihabitans sp. VKM Ac-2883]RPE74485.1 hypothetical protein EDF37_3229 [Frondihabitans sp. PhB153]RPF02914.1 hypothetical protein EDF39_3297 [Frondihabitans sp. PhB161]